MTVRETLIAAASDYADDIETCNTIAIEYLGASDTQTPGAYINFLKSIDTDTLREQASYLKNAVEKYEPLRPGNSDFKAVMEDWSGDGADSFEKRWGSLSRFVGYDSEDTDTVIGRLNAHHDRATTFLDTLEEAQSNCTDLIITKLHDAADIWDTISTVGADAGTGAGIGTLFPGIGTFIGGSIGILNGVLKVQGDQAETLQTQIDGIQAIGDTTQGLEPMVADTDREIGEIDYDPEGGSLDGGWEQ